MNSGTVVVLPADDSRHASMRGRLLNGDFAVRGVAAVDGPSATEAARICAAINADPPEGPMTIVAFGEAALMLPAVALAQRAAHRRVREYVLVDPRIPAVSDGWPDAHVTVFSDDDQAEARLRGWAIAPMSSLSEWMPPED